jgi:lysophospholipase L1-like esterase
MSHATISPRLAQLAAAGLAAAVIAVIAATPVTHTSVASGATPSGYYLSLGDSLAGGVTTTGDPLITLDGFSNQLVTDLASSVTLTLENFGCGGATTSSVIDDVGCPGGGAAFGVTYPSTTQAAAAVGFIDAHPGQVKLITISLGANDYSDCITPSPTPQSCVAAAMPGVETNIETLTSELRSAVGPSVPIIGVNDFIDALGYWVDGGGGHAVAKAWVSEFRDTIVPALTKAYATADAPLVDTAGDAGAYRPLSKTVDDPTYGTVPLAVSRVCTLTYVCVSDVTNVHPNTMGYGLMAREIAKTYRSLKARASRVSGRSARPRGRRR